MYMRKAYWVRCLYVFFGRVRAVASMANARKTFQLADFLNIGYDCSYLIPNYLSVYKKFPASIVFIDVNM